MSVIDTRTDTVAATIWTKPSPADLLGATPNAVAFAASGQRLYVANGSQNAIAVVEFDGDEPDDSRLCGCIPVGWYPGALLVDEVRSQLMVANIKGLPKMPRQEEDRTGFNSHHYSGSLSLVPIPPDEHLPALGEQVQRNLQRPRIAEALLPPRPNQPPRAIPAANRRAELDQARRVHHQGEPHVRSGVRRARAAVTAMHRCAFSGARSRPTTTRWPHEFVLLDNTYCCRDPERRRPPVEHHRLQHRLHGEELRRLPAQLSRRHGRRRKRRLGLFAGRLHLGQRARHQASSIRNYGEFMGPSVRWRDHEREGTPDFLACYRTWKGEDGRRRLRKLAVRRDPSALLAHALTSAGKCRYPISFGPTSSSASCAEFEARASSRNW